MPEHNLNSYACLPTYFPPLSTANTFILTGCSKYQCVVHLYLITVYVCYDVCITLLLFGHPCVSNFHIDTLTYNKCMLDIFHICKPKETISNIFFKSCKYKIKWYPQRTEPQHTDPNPWQTATAVIAALPAVKLNHWILEGYTTLQKNVHVLWVQKRPMNQKKKFN
jgi:hypothetical protein